MARAHALSASGTMLPWKFVILIVCRTGMAALTGSDGPFDCGDEPYMMMEEVLHNNLGHKGPHQGSEGILYKAVEYFQNMHRDVQVHLHTDSLYNPWNVFANGLNGRFGVFNQLSGHPLDVAFRFTDLAGKPLILKSFSLSIYDMDRDQNPGEGVENVTPVTTVHRVYRTSDTLVQENSGSYLGTVPGTYDDNPVQVVAQSKADEDKCLVLEYKDVHTVRITFDSTKGFAARTTQFCLLNALKCKVKPDKPSSWHVPVGSGFVPVLEEQAPLKVRTGQAFNFSIPRRRFEDASGLTFTASLVDDQPLPEWLHFDAATLSLAGRPSQAFPGDVDVKITAEDVVGLKTDMILPVEVGGGPVVERPVQPQHLFVGRRFNFTLPEGSFLEPAGGGSLSLRTSRLPAWLHFDAAHGRFSGVPPTNGVVEVNVTATDSEQRAVTQNVVLVLIKPRSNHPPYIASHIQNSQVKLGEALHFVIPTNAFKDLDGEALILQAARSDGRPLPPWLHFDPASRAFSGQPGEADAGLLALRLTARDGHGAGVKEDFVLNITGGHEGHKSQLSAAPVPLVHFDDRKQEAAIGKRFSFKVPRLFGRHIGSLHLLAKRSDGSPLPKWLTFEPETRTFQGVPGLADAGLLSVEVIAEAGGATARDSFLIDVAQPSTALATVMLNQPEERSSILPPNWVLALGLLALSLLTCILAFALFGVKVSFVNKKRLSRGEDEGDYAPVGQSRIIRCCNAKYENFQNKTTEAALADDIVQLDDP